VKSVFAPARQALPGVKSVFAPGAKRIQYETGAFAFFADTTAVSGAELLPFSDTVVRHVSEAHVEHKDNTDLQSGSYRRIANSPYPCVRDALRNISNNAVIRAVAGRLFPLKEGVHSEGLLRSRSN
jgi:hypothetical protein